MISLLIYSYRFSRVNTYKQTITHHERGAINTRRRRNDGRDSRRTQLSHRTDSRRREQRLIESTVRCARPTGHNSVQARVAGNPFDALYKFSRLKNQTHPLPLDSTPFVPSTLTPTSSPYSSLLRQNDSANNVSIFSKIQSVIFYVVFE